MIPQLNLGPNKDFGMEVYNLLKDTLYDCGSDWKGPCPIEDCGGEDRFSINKESGLIHCRQCYARLDPDGTNTKQATSIFISSLCKALGFWKLDNAGHDRASGFWADPEPGVHFYETTNQGVKFHHYQYFTDDGTPTAQVYKNLQTREKRRRYFEPTENPDKPWLMSKDTGITPEHAQRYRHLLFNKENFDTTANIIHIAEGESDCIELSKLGFIATTNLAGGKGFTYKNAEQFPDNGNRLVIWQDNDDIGIIRPNVIMKNLLLAQKKFKHIIIITPEMMGFDPDPKTRKGEDVRLFIMLQRELGLNDEEIKKKILEMIVDAESTTYTEREESKPVDRRKYDTSQVALARMLLEEHAKDMLIVEEDNLTKKYSFPTVYTSDHKGRWDNDAVRPLEWFIKGIERLQEEVLKESFGEKVKHQIFSKLNSLKTRKEFELVLDAVPAVHNIMLEEMNQNIEEKSEWQTLGVYTCRHEELDSNYRYLSCLNGIVDLDTGNFAHNPKAALCTQQIPTLYNPESSSPIIDNLFSHIEPELQEWWWNTLAYHLRYGPSRRFYLIVGPPQGGKTTLNHLIHGALGPYVGEAHSEVLNKSKRKSSAMLSPELFVMLPPHRFTILSDIDDTYKDSTLIKKVSGGDPLTVRGLRQMPVTRTCRTTIIFMGNPGSVPKFDLSADEAVLDRYRELPYDAVPENKRNPELVELAKQRSSVVTEPFLNKLVTYAIKQKLGNLPETPDVVTEAVKQREESEGTSLKDFCDRFVRRNNSNLTSSEIWGHWLMVNNKPMTHDDAVVNGVPRSMIMRNMRKFTNLFNKEQRYRTQGKQKRGYVNVHFMGDDEWAEFCSDDNEEATVIPMSSRL